MLAPLSNEVIFKIAFTDREVLTCFVRDILGLDVILGNIETEKRFSPKIGNIDFAYDIFAETEDERFIIEIQNVEYDYHFDRFLHYHNMAISEQQKSSKDYKTNQVVYTIVIISSPYDGLDINGNPIKDEVLISSADPRNLMDKLVPIFGHKFILLNPHNRTDSMPANYRDWLDLIYESIYNQENYRVNLKNEGIRKAVQLIDYDRLSPLQIREMKEEEGRKVVLSMYDTRVKRAEAEKQKAEEEKQKAEQEKEEAIKKAEEDKSLLYKTMVNRLFARGQSFTEIAETTGLTLS